MEETGSLNVYKCPSCGGAVRYDARTGALSCMWCGNAYDAASLEAREVGAGLHGYLCPECGAQLMADDYIAADTCPYCGNNEIAPQRFEGAFEPDYIIPFSVTKQQAMESYRQHLADKEFLHESFAEEAQVLSVQGAYVPFWLKDGTVKFDFTYQSLKRRSGRYAGYDERHYRRKGTYDYTRVPADASERMADDMMDSIEPFDFDALEPFSLEYLPGFVAERYTVDPAEVDRRVYLRIQVAAVRAARETVPSDSGLPVVQDDRCWTAPYQAGEVQALLPVWLIVVAHGGKKYLVGVNGQTGKVAANLPVNEEKQEAAAQEAKARSIPLLALPELPYALLLAFIAYLAGDLVFDSIGKLTGAVASDGIGWPIFGLLVAAAFLAAVVYFGVLGTKMLYAKMLERHDAAQESARRTVQNVEEAAYRGEYDASRLTITYSEQEMGPTEPPVL